MVNNMLNYFLISIFYFWASSTSLSMGIGYYTIYRPVMAGMFAGLILGDVQTGLLTGAIVNIIYIDFVSTGGSFKGDQCLTAVMACAAAIIFKLNPVEAAAIAFPFGFMGIFIWKYRLKINNIFVHMYEKSFDNNFNPDISIYNGLLPQLLLYVMSSAVILASFLLMNIFYKLLAHFIILKDLLYYAGLLLIVFSVTNILFKIKNKYSIVIFISMFLVSYVFKIKALFLFIALLIFLAFIWDKNIFIKNYDLKNKVIKKNDLQYSWFIWMNYSHSCYSYERLMGMAFAHSMKNIFKKLYSDKRIIAKAIHNHTEFFNTEPNMGTPIHGYIISLEEDRILNKESFENSNISYIKKGMMGVAAGLGDSFTQVVLTPLFISMSVMLAIDKNFFMALLPVLILSLCIIYISYTGFMMGYYGGKESLLERIKNIKNSKLKIYFPYIFSAILGLTTSNLLFGNLAVGESTAAILIILIIGLFAFLKNRGRI